MTQPDPISTFHGKTISYTYDNGWSFTNTFTVTCESRTFPGASSANTSKLPSSATASSSCPGSTMRWD